MNEWAPVATVYNPLRAGSIDGTDVEPHDRAVWRAMVARYVPNKEVVGDPHRTLFVSRLNRQTTEEKLKEVFSKYGDIQRLRLVRDIVTGISKGYAFIEYKEERALLKAHRDANKLIVDQRELFVDFEQERTLKGWVPRRLGGGLGGKKESGQLRFGGRDRPFRKPINLPMMMSDHSFTDRQHARGERQLSQERVRDRQREKGIDRDERRRDRSQDRERARREERERSDRDHDKERKDSKRERHRSKERDSKRAKDESRHRDKDRHKDRK
ncbi:U1SBP protein, partial [Polyodon spathula]|nr:U11/U12 small nuclear ribonucleoprotein 35 kDa protein [Polyodon spathula]MBN3282904.1 U1SBP protein [Polyodon spathula]